MRNIEDNLSNEHTEHTEQRMMRVKDIPLNTECVKGLYLFSEAMRKMVGGTFVFTYNEERDYWFDGINPMIHWSKEWLEPHVP